MLNSSSEQTITTFEHLCNVILATRSAGYDKQLDVPPTPKGAHISTNLNRNRAAIVVHFLKSNKFIGRDWLGVSGAAELHSATGLKVLRPTEDGAVDVGLLLGCQESVCLEHTFIPNPKRWGCSEVALVNALHHYMLAFGDGQGGWASDEPANLYLVTERLPCDSCSNILKLFLAMHPNISLHVGYMFDIYAEAVEKDYHDFLKHKAFSARLYKLQLVSSKDTGFTAKDVNGVPLPPRWSPSGFQKTSWIDEVSIGKVEYCLSICEATLEVSGKVVVGENLLHRDSGEASAHFIKHIGLSP